MSQDRRVMAGSASRFGRYVGGCLLVGLVAAAFVGVVLWGLVDSLSSMCWPGSHPPCGGEEGLKAIPFERSSRSTDGTEIAILFADWDVQDQRGASRSVALRVSYRPTADGFEYSTADWVARDAAGTTHHAELGPDPALGSGVRDRGQIAMGWVSFAVRRSTATLEVTYRGEGTKSLSWTVTPDGASVPSTSPQPTRASR